MLKRFFVKRSRAVPGPVGRLPEGMRAYAVGDIHGRDDLFAALLAQIGVDDDWRGTAQTHLILLGDLIDRGPASAAVIERARQLAAAKQHVTVLAGNHEQIFLELLEGKTRSLRFFERIGGRETLLSYGVTEENFLTLDLAELLDLVQDLVPMEHVRFLRDMPDKFVLGDYLFVHAGIRPGVALEKQEGEDLRWIRGEFLESNVDHGCIVVHGHTPTSAVEWQSNRIGIDTGAWASGRLTALGLEGSDRWLIETAD